MAKKTNYKVNGIEYYRVRAKIGTKADGSQILKPFYGSSKKEAEAARDEYLTGIKSGMAIDSDKLIFREFFSLWLDEVRRPVLTQNSWNRYDSIHRLHIAPTALYNMNVKDIRSIHVQKALNRASTPYNAEWIHLLLAMFFKYCIAERIVQYSPMVNVTLPARPQAKSEKKYLEPAEIQTLLEAFEADDSLFIFVFAIYTGMRQGEILALTHKDIDLKAKTITVNKSVKRITMDTQAGRKSVAKVGSPKTESGHRVLPIHNSLLKPLAHQKALIKEKYTQLGKRSEYGPNALLFSSKILEPLRADRLTAHWHKVQSDLGIGDITFHQLRHTFGTILCEAGVPIMTAMDLMGHSSKDMIEQIYGHVRKESKDLAMHAFDTYLETNAQKQKLTTF